MSRLRPAALALAAVALAALLGGCGGDDGAGTQSAAATATTTAHAEGRPVTDEQALALARVLQQNWQRGGARFTGSVVVHGTAIPMSGRADFRSGRGTATLREPGAASRRYVWTRRAVYAQSDPGSRRYAVQRPDPDGDPVHAAIALINLLSAETIDNTANIQDQGARFLRGDTVDGTPVDVYRYRSGGGATYAIGRDDGLLRQLDARLPAGELVVTLTSHEPVRVAVPEGQR
ncbi:hypothetical protein [Conexibacter woesei]|uniref:Lipoprotein n=1 Tax=Conexibacter woesei (strain DSM 14684 / CCUG 47730 / CIP 108061 / JCM 11494 / NBRC 100937 / ID131577) TaxID=469383 RepID=D3F6E0_CONWI|nr:hypothetical protein [Conexibacter woesei]ADB50707.1 hypothetical protein Cwoe_2282 [Conexibacter woesei DSM 14684]